MWIIFSQRKCDGFVLIHPVCKKNWVSWTAARASSVLRCAAFGMGRFTEPGINAFFISSKEWCLFSPNRNFFWNNIEQVFHFSKQYSNILGSFDTDCKPIVGLFIGSSTSGWPWISSLEAAYSPWHPKRRISVFFDNFCIFRYCDKLQLLGMVKGLATVAKDTAIMG